MTNAPAGTFNLPQEFQREHQLLHSRPRLRRPAIRPTQCADASGAAARCPTAPSRARRGAPAPAQPSLVALTGHQADAERRLIRRCRPVPRGDSHSSCQSLACWVRDDATAGTYQPTPKKITGLGSSSRADQQHNVLTGYRPRRETQSRPAAARAVHWHA
jgi:hypothetical protein